MPRADLSFLTSLARRSLARRRLPFCPRSYLRSSCQSGSDLLHVDGKSEEVSGKKGDAVFSPAGAHLPENIGSGPIEVILVELKKPATK